MSRESFENTLEKTTIGLAVAVALYHIAASRFVIFAFEQHKTLHVGAALSLIFLEAVCRGRIRERFFYGLFFFVAAAISVYFVADYYSLVMNIGYPETFPTVLGGIMILLTLEASRKTWGWIIPTIALATMAYAYFGQYLPGIFFHGGMAFARLIAYASIYFRGIYGSLTGVSSIEVFLFILFGSLLKAAGALDLFMQLGMVVSRKFRSGPAQTAVVSSALMGTVSGTVAGNVATTGTFTIPSMISKGFSPEYAGAVEACSSTGGQIMPPVMGVAAFLIVGLTGIPYAHVALGAILPALLYYIYLGISIEIRAAKRGFRRETASLSGTMESLIRNSCLALPLVVLVVSLALHNPTSAAAFHSIVSLVVVVAGRELILKKGDLGTAGKSVIRLMVSGLNEGARNGAKIAVVMATLGIVVEMFVVTGFGQKLSQAILSISEGSILVLLLMTAATCIFFGMGMPTTGAYILVALLAAPAMVNQGVPLLHAHMFVFYYGVMSNLSPPVAAGALVACGISGGNYLKTAVLAFRLALPGFLLPLFFVFRPEILWLGYPFFQVIFSFLVVLVGLVAATAAIENHLLRKLRIFERILLTIAALCAFTHGVTSSLIGVGILLGLVLVQYLGYRKSTSPSSSMA